MHGEGAGYRDHAVLYRMNSQSRALEDELRRMGIPYRVVGGLRFYDRKEVKDLIAYLRLVANPADSISLRRVINAPPRGIGAMTMARLGDYAMSEGSSLFEAMRRAGRAQGDPAGDPQASRRLRPPHRRPSRAGRHRDRSRHPEGDHRAHGPRADAAGRDRDRDRFTEGERSGAAEGGGGVRWRGPRLGPHRVPGKRWRSSLMSTTCARMRMAWR